MGKAVIFDLDGTLLDTLDDIADSVNAALAHFSLPPVTREKVRRSVGNGGRMLIRRCVPGGEEYPLFNELFSWYEPYYEKHCRIKTRPYEGIMEMLRALKNSDVRMAIVSNKGDGAVKELSRLYFQDLAAAAVGERPGIRRKPCPDAVLEAMRQMECDRADALYVGDSEVDFETAARAGIRCVLVTWGFREKSALEALGPDGIADSARELRAWIDAWAAGNLTGGRK